MNTRRFLTALALTSAIGVGAFAGAAHAASSDVDNVDLSLGGVGIKSTMTWTETTYNGAPRDLGEFSVSTYRNTSGRCATITIDWFDGTDPRNPNVAISNMTQSVGCTSVPTITLNQVIMSRLNEPRAIKAVTCLKVSGTPVLAPVCKTSNAFFDDSVTHI